MKQIQLSRSEAVYLRDLLNEQADNPKRKDDKKLYNILGRLNLFPIKRRNNCPVCFKIVHFEEWRKGRVVHIKNYPCGKKCIDELKELERAQIQLDKELLRKGKELPFGIMKKHVYL